MRIDVLLALTTLAIAAPQQRGSVSSVSAMTAPAGQATVFRISGNNPCGTLRVDFGDGSTRVHDIQGMPVEIRHTYSKPGTYQVRARGTGNCVGLAAMTVRVEQTTGRSLGGATVQPRFRAMDRNADGRVTRAEWRGSAQSFRMYDWNGDGVLSGDEMRAGATVPVGTPGDAIEEPWLEGWTGQRFLQLDANGNNRLERTEWPWRADAFDWLDGNGDGWLSRAEVLTEGVPARDQFWSMDANRDETISPNEWPWSRASFDRLDRNSDGRLTRTELESTRPIGATGDSAPVTVLSTERWTDTAIDVRAGDILTFQATGSIEMSGESGDPADPTGSRTGRRAPNAPLPNEPAGILLARIGTGAPIEVGRTTRIRASLDGRLYLGVNDDYLGDNHGEYRVVVSVGR
jgi:Ca2+-binding EF-hand superfamily protein